jgi:hypothetical protein
MSKIQQQQIFVTSDEAQHTSIEAAEAHQFALDNAEVINTVAESFVNVNNLVGRTRAFNINVAKAALAYVLSSGGSIPEDFEAVEPSAELQAKLDEEAAKVKAKAAKSTAKEGEEAPADDAEADADLFKED